jgi:hypothetical protein
MPLAAAAAVLIVVLGLVVGLHLAGSNSPKHASNASIQRLDQLVVHDGDRVQAQAEVYRTTTGPALCIGGTPATIAAATCLLPVANLADVSTSASGLVSSSGATFPWGTTVAVTGQYDNGTVRVKTLATPAFTRPAAPPAPCATPNAGWPPTIASADRTKLQTYLTAHPADFGFPWSYQQRSASSGGNVQVEAVGTSGDIPAAAKALAALYRGPLCIYQTDQTVSHLTDVRSQAERILGGIGGDELATSGFGVDTVDLRITFLSPENANALHPYAASITVNPALKPV